ncbi:MAG: hypothetical protein LH479_01320 [Polaromonas sp.]|nr:hypothetical protein [Polaromonas sp.]
MTTLADDPTLRLVLVQTAVWKTAGDRSERAEMLSLWKGIVEHYGGPGASVR